MPQIANIKWILIEKGYPDNCRPVLLTYRFSDDEYCIAIGEYWFRVLCDNGTVTLVQFLKSKYWEQHKYDRRYK